MKGQAERTGAEQGRALEALLCPNLEESESRLCSIAGDAVGNEGLHDPHWHWL